MQVRVRRLSPGGGRDPVGATGELGEGWVQGQGLAFLCSRALLWAEDWAGLGEGWGGGGGEGPGGAWGLGRPVRRCRE